MSLRPPRKGVVLWFEAVAVVAIAIAVLVFKLQAGEMRDFEVYWTAAARASAGEPLYRTEDGHYQFKYLPAFAVLASPISRLSLDSAKAGWFGASIALLALLVWFSIAALPQQRRPTWLLVVVVLFAMGKFYGHELVLGQVNTLFAVLAMGGVLALQRDRIALASTMFVLALVIKPYAVIFLPWVVYLAGQRALAVVTAGLLVVFLLPVPGYGYDGAIDLHRQWWKTVTESTAPNLRNPDNVSIAGFLSKWLTTTSARIATGISTVLLLLTSARIIQRGRRLAGRETLECALLLTIVPLVSPQGWDYVFLVATPAVVLFANYDDRVPLPLRFVTWIALAVIGLSLYDLLGRQRYATFMAWSVITVCFVVIVAALAAVRWRRAA